MIRIGAQVPMAGGLLCALDYATSTGCETMQVFAKSPRRWAGPPTDPKMAADFRAACISAGIGPVFTHASYLINMGAEGDELWERSTAALADELTRAADIGAAGVVIHLGRRFSDDDAECVARVTACATNAAALAGDRCVPLLLENSAGAGRQFGVSVDEMAAAMVSVRDAGVETALCFDTCHGFAGGIDVRGDEGWHSALERLTSLAGSRAVRLVHANDCKGEFGSHKDRHEWIGDGHIGAEGFAAMMRQAALDGASVVVEMPGEGPYKDAENVRRLKSLRDGGVASAAQGPGRA
ncbi:MAG TPA: deoxyribonuclease IV [Coriobacteriia bacterium]